MPRISASRTAARRPTNIASQMLQPKVTTPMAIAYEPTATNATCPKFARPV